MDRGRGSGPCGQGGQAHVDIHAENLKIYDLRVKRLKKIHQKFWQMKHRKFAGRIPKTRKILEKRGHFLDGMWTSTRGSGVRLMWMHVHRGGAQKPDFRVDIINGRPLICYFSICM